MTGKDYKSNGFTLIEIVVVMGIISLMVGIMIPLVYRVWESEEISSTEDRIMKLKEAMVGIPSQMNSGMRSNFGFTGELGQLPPDLDALVSYTNINGTFGPFISGGVDPQSFKQDAWGYSLIYAFTTDAFGRRQSATITSLGSDNAPGGTETAADIQVPVDTSEVLPASTLSCNVLIRYGTAPAVTFNANVTVHIAHKNGEGAFTEQIFVSPVTITANVGNPENNYSFGLSSGLTQNVPIGVAQVWADIDRDSSGNLIMPAAAGPASYIAVNDQESTMYANSLSVSVP